MVDIREYTKQRLLEFVYEVQEGRVPNRLLLEYAADALLRSLNKKVPDVIPPISKGRKKGEQRDLDLELQAVWLRKIEGLKQEDVCERLHIGEPKTIGRLEGYFRRATLAEVREYNKILSEYRLGRKMGSIPVGKYYKVMCVFEERRIVDETGEREAQKFIWSELNRSHAEAITSLTKKDSK